VTSHTPPTIMRGAHHDGADDAPEQHAMLVLPGTR
jgi:hypothetical protein